MMAGFYSQGCYHLEARKMEKEKEKEKKVGLSFETFPKLHGAQMGYHSFSPQLKR